MSATDLLITLRKKVEYLVNQRFDAPQSATITLQGWDVVDTTGKLSIASGKLICAGGLNTPSYTDPSIIAKNTVSVVPGKLVFFKVKQTGGAYLRFGLTNVTPINTNPFGQTITKQSTLIVFRDGTVFFSAPLGLSTTDEYEWCIALRDTGSYVFIKGGVFVVWTLFAYLNSTKYANLYPFVSDYDSTATYDDIKIPTQLWLPAPIISDAFSRLLDSLSDFTPNPTLGSELLTNPSFEGGFVGGLANGYYAISAPTLSDEQTIVYGGNHSQKFVTTATLSGIGSNMVTGTPFAWYVVSIWSYCAAGKIDFIRSVASFISGAPSNSSASWVQQRFTVQANSSGQLQLAVRSGVSVTTGYVDDMSIKVLGIPDLISVKSIVGATDIRCVCIPTVVQGFQNGIACKVDSSSNPQNYCIAYFDGYPSYSVRLDIVVGGVTTNRAVVVQAYTAGYELSVRINNNTVYVYYQAAGSTLLSPISTYTLSAGEITALSANTLYGVFATNTTAKVASFRAYAENVVIGVSDGKGHLEGVAGGIGAGGSEKSWGGTMKIINKMATPNPTITELITTPTIQGFEDAYSSGVANGWLKTGTCVLTEDLVLFKSGLKSQKVVTSAVGSGITLAIKSGYPSGTWVLLSAYVNLASGDCYVKRENGDWYNQGVIVNTTGSWILTKCTMRLGASGNNGGITITNGNTAASTFNVDDASIKLLPLSDIISTVNCNASSVIIDAVPVYSYGLNCGVAACWNSQTNPQNGMIAFFDGQGKIRLDTCIAGVWTVTARISATQAYVAGATLKLIKHNNDIYLYYNNAQIGTMYTLSIGEATAFGTNTLHGIFSTDTDVPVSNCVIYSDGSNNEYSILGSF